jgi:hypothetical protein
MPVTKSECSISIFCSVGFCFSVLNRYRLTNQELTDAYRRVTEQFKDLQLKVRQLNAPPLIFFSYCFQVKHFEMSDAQKFEEVWKMKEQDVQEMLSALLTADKIISEQQLGRLWFPPSNEALQKTFEQGKRRALAAGKKRTDPNVGENDLLQLTAASSQRVQEVPRYFNAVFAHVST